MMQQPRSQGLSSLPPLSLRKEGLFSTTMEAENRDPGNEVDDAAVTAHKEHDIQQRKD